MKTLPRVFALIVLGVVALVLITPAQAARRSSYPTNPGDGTVALLSPP